MDTHIHHSIHTHSLTRANATAIPVLARTNIIQPTHHVRHLATTRVTTLATIRIPARTGLAWAVIHAEITAIQATA